MFIVKEKERGIERTVYAVRHPDKLLVTLFLFHDASGWYWDEAKHYVPKKDLKN